MTRKALGRGLSALLSEIESGSGTGHGLTDVAVGSIDPNPFQPRRSFTEAGLSELAQSIKSQGILQPVLVRPAGTRYQLVAGERRWRAARLAGAETVPAIVRDLQDRDLVELALAENLLRQDLNAIEEAHGYQLLQDKFGLSQQEIAEHLGLSRAAVTNTLRLLNLPESVQAMIQDGKLSAGHARAVLVVKGAEAQIKFAGLIIERNLSVRDAEKMAGRQPEPDVKEPGETSPDPPSLDPNVRAAVVELERRLGTKVRIVGGQDRGRVEISYFSSEDLNRIYQMLIESGQK